MRNYFESDDPIQEVGRKSIFGRIKSFEESDEYNFEKEMEEYEKSFSKEQTINRNVNYQTSAVGNEFSKLIIVISIFIMMFPMIFMMYGALDLSKSISYVEVKELPIEKSLGEENPVLEDELDLQIYYKLSSIDFNNAGSIVALYKFDRRTVANWCNFTERDERFNGMVNTFQINYDYIPTLSKEKLKNGLTTRGFEHIKEYSTGSVYAINKNNGYFLFVLISEKDLIYGSASGRYQDVFGE